MIWISINFFYRISFSILMPYTDYQRTACPNIHRDGYLRGWWMKNYCESL